MFMEKRNKITERIEVQLEISNGDSVQEQELSDRISKDVIITEILPAKETITSSSEPEVHRPSEPWINPSSDQWIGADIQGGNEPENYLSSGQENIRDREPDHHRTIDPAEHFSRSFLDLSAKPSDLTIEQFIILHFIYFNRPFKVRSDKGLAVGDLLNPPMTASNVRNRLKSLVNKGYIGKPYSVNDGISQGSSCLVNLVQCLKLFGPSGLVADEPVDNRINDPLNHRLCDPEIKRIREQEGGLYSSRVNKKTTTRNDIDLNDPELNFWIDYGLTEKTVKNLMEECNITEFAVITSLKNAAFDMVVNKRIEKIKLKNPLNYFFGVMKKNCYYPKPYNYKSYLQIIIEQEEAEKKSLERETEYYEKLIREKNDLGVNLVIKRILAEPDGELYKKCFNALPAIRKEKFKNPLLRRGPLFEMDMKIAYGKIHIDKRELEDGQRSEDERQCD